MALSVIVSLSAINVLAAMSIHQMMLIFAIAGVLLTVAGYFMFDSYIEEFGSEDSLLNDISWVCYWLSTALYVFGIVFSLVIAKMF